MANVQKMCGARLQLRNLLQILFLLIMYSTFAAADVMQHICKYDELRKNEPAFNEIEELQTIQFPPENPKDPLLELAANTLSTKGEEYSSLRIKVSTQGMDDTKSCKKVGQTVKDAKGNDYQCTVDDLLSDEKKSTIKQIIEKAVQMHTSRLKVKKLSNGFKVPAFTESGFCSRLTILDEDKTTGISNDDFVLYVSAASFKDKPNYAYGFPCAIDKVTKRPLVGGLVIDPKHIDESDYSTRVLAHEIGHALGFDLDIIQAVKPIVKKQGVRGKPDVNEFRGDKVIEKVKDHYNCAAATGMEVEDQKPDSRTAWRGSLWESRNAKDELMAGVVRKGLYTYFTLAFFEDLGFYKADYTNAEHMDWGYKMGCEFLTKKCIENGVSNFPTMFCTEENKEKLFCTANGRTMGTCVGLNTQNSENIDFFYKYFADNRKTGYPHLLTDNCPYIEEKSGADCQGDDDVSKLPGKKGPKSWCVHITHGKVRNLFNGHNGMCVERTENGNKGISFTFSEMWKPIMCNTQKTDSMRDENSFNNIKFYCSQPDEVFIEEGEGSVSPKSQGGTIKGNKKNSGLIKEWSNKSGKDGVQSNTNNVTLINTLITLLFFAILALY